MRLRNEEVRGSNPRTGTIFNYLRQANFPARQIPGVCLGFLVAVSRRPAHVGFAPERAHWLGGIAVGIRLVSVESN